MSVSIPLSTNLNKSISSRVKEKERMEGSLDGDANRKSKKAMENKNRRANKPNNTRQQGTKHERTKRSNYFGVLDESCSALDCHFFLLALHVLVELPQAPSIVFSTIKLPLLTDMRVNTDRRMESKSKEVTIETALRT